MNLNILVKEDNNKKITLFIDNNEIGIINKNSKKDIELKGNEGALYIKYGDKKSNVFELNNNQKEYQLEIDKGLKINKTNPSAILRVIIPFFLMCFCFHKAFGIGYYVFTFVILLLIVMFASNKNKLFIREVK